MKGLAAYVYTISVDGVVRYIGKGRGKRLHDHMKMVHSIMRRQAAGEQVQTTLFYRKLVARWREGCQVEETIILDGLTDEDAFSAEREAIAAYPKGHLWNTDIGGKGRSSEGMRAEWQSERGEARRDRLRARLLAGGQQLMAEAAVAAHARPEEKERKKAATKRQHENMSDEAKAARSLRIRAGNLARHSTSLCARALEAIERNPGIKREDLAILLDVPKAKLSVPLCHLTKKTLLRYDNEWHYWRTEVSAIAAVSQRRV